MNTHGKSNDFRIYLNQTRFHEICTRLTLFCTARKSKSAASESRKRLSQAFSGFSVSCVSTLIFHQNQSKCSESRNFQFCRNSGKSQILAESQSILLELFPEFFKKFEGIFRFVSIVEASTRKVSQAWHVVQQLEGK